MSTILEPQPVFPPLAALIEEVEIHCMKATVWKKERTARRLRESIERIVNGVPSSPKLVAKLRAKRALRLSIQAVADESGVSRETIYTHHPEIRREIEARAQKRPTVRISASGRRESALRDQIALLKQHIADVMSENAALLKRVTVAEGRVKRAEDRLQSTGVGSETSRYERRGR